MVIRILGCLVVVWQLVCCLVISLLFECLGVWSFGRLIVWFVGCWVVCLLVWSFGLFVCSSFCCLVVSLFGCLVACLFGRLIVWSLGRFDHLAVWLFVCDFVGLPLCMACFCLPTGDHMTKRPNDQTTNQPRDHTTKQRNNQTTKGRANEQTK